MSTQVKSETEKEQKSHTSLLMTFLVKPQLKNQIIFVVSI